MPRHQATALSVNLNKIALLRNSREGNFPNVIDYAKTCLSHGANGITVHPRPDQRHIRPHDVAELHHLLRSFPEIEFNIEGNPFSGSLRNYPGFMALVEQYRPEQCTLVPDSQDQLTSDHGFDLIHQGENLKPIINKLKTWGCRISLFMDPDIRQIDRAAELGVERIELYTGPYAKTFGDGSSPNSLAILATYAQAAHHAKSLGLGVNAGHDLNLVNLKPLLDCAEIEEVSIGHALTVDALNMGFGAAVSAYSKLCRLR